MSSQPLVRTTYEDQTNTPRGGNTGRGESRVDMEQYYQFLEQIHGSGLHSWGIATGLKVTVSTSPAGLQISPGIGLDANGKHISLAAGGKAEVNASPAGTVASLAAVSATGVTFPTPTNSAGDQYLTIEWRETFDDATWISSGGQTFQKLHTPWLRLQPLSTFPDPKTVTGQQLILGRVTLDASGTVTNLTPEYRRIVSVSVGSLLLQRATADPAPALGLASSEAASIQLLESGGLQIGTTDNQPLVIQTNGQERMLIDATGNVGIGTTNPGAQLEVDADSIQAVYGHSNTGDAVVGFSADATGVMGKTLSGTGVYGGGGQYAGYFEGNVAVTNGKVTVTGGQVGFGTTSPSAQLEVDAAIDNMTAVYGHSNTGDGVVGFSATAYGVQGSSDSNTGVVGRSNSSIGVTGISNSNIGVYGKGGQYAGFFDGNVTASGNVGIGTDSLGSRLVIAASHDGDGIGLRGSRAGTKDVGISFYDEGGRGGSLGFASASNAWMTGVSVADMVLMSYNGRVLLGSGPDTATPTVTVSSGGVGIDGALQVHGTKQFVQDHPSDLTKQIVYVSLEGGEAGTYTRGTWKLEEGKAVIDLPEHFGLVTNDDGLSVQLTPRGEWLQLYVVHLTTRQLVVEEAQGKSGQFDYFIQGVRNGYEHHEVIQQKKEARFLSSDNQNRSLDSTRRSR